MSQQLHVLLIEDDDSFAVLVRRILRKLSGKHRGYHVTELSDAVEALTAQSFHVAVTDLTLPDVVRLLSVERLRATNPGLPVVVLSVMDSIELGAEAVQAGAQDFIVKDSIMPAFLERAFQNAVQRQKMVERNTQLIDKRQSQQQQLSQKNTRLQHLIKTTHGFADNVSHEFRTSLTVIREYAAPVGEGVQNYAIFLQENDQHHFAEDGVECLDGIINGIRRMIQLIADFLECSLGESQRIAMQPTDLNIVFQDVLHLLESEIEAAAATIECDPLLIVTCDTEQISQLFRNLISNSLKHRGQESVKICVSVGEGKSCEIVVEDNGIGIDPQFHSEVFDIFRRLHTQTEAPGAGIGLALCRRIVDRQNGTMFVDSLVGQGSRFVFKVSLAQERISDVPAISDSTPSKAFLGRLEPSTSHQSELVS